MLLLPTNSQCNKHCIIRIIIAIKLRRHYYHCPKSHRFDNRFVGKYSIMPQIRQIHKSPLVKGRFGHIFVCDICDITDITVIIACRVCHTPFETEMIVINARQSIDRNGIRSFESE